MIKAILAKFKHPQQKYIPCNLDKSAGYNEILVALSNSLKPKPVNTKNLAWFKDALLGNNEPLGYFAFKEIVHMWTILYCFNVQANYAGMIVNIAGVF